MVSPYPPLRDGIASYALQTVAALRAEGHAVEVLAPGPSAAASVSARGQVRVAPRGEDFTRPTGLDRKTARGTLGIPDEAFMFLSRGFIRPDKGCDRAIRAFSGLGGARCRLVIGGSVRVE